MMEIEKIIEKFNEHYSGIPRIFRAPGRVNLIGEHTDYNDGFVFPMAIDHYTTVAIMPRQDHILAIWSEDMDDGITIDLNENETKRDHWSDYVAGIARMLELEGFELPGADVYLESEVPVGSGLSSSAALEMSSALALLSTVDGKMEQEALAKLGQRAENQFVGMNCGIMDQFISIHGKKDHALFLDCRTLDYQFVPLPSDHVRVVICNTMVKHELGASEYNKRRAECETGVRILSEDYPGIKTLRDISLAQFQQDKNKLPEIVRKRCRHVISENERTRDSVSALKNNNLKQFGVLMNASHDSLRDDYEVSCEELDLMVNIARSLDGVLGARMTGGGFGGCTVNLVGVEHVDHFCEEISKQYQLSTEIEPKIYVSVPSQGAHEIT